MFHGHPRIKHAAGAVAVLAGAATAVLLPASAQASTIHHLRHAEHIEHLRVIGVTGTPQLSAYTYTAGPGGGFAQCVISRESGGNPRAVNPVSGAGGLYQFLPGTWASLGYSGLPQDASVATQTQAFYKLYDELGSGPWASDGCAG